VTPAVGTPWPPPQQGLDPPWRRRLAAVFADPTAHRGTVGGALLGAAAVLAGAAVSLLRHPGAVALDTVWAEDGTVFLAGAVNDSPLRAVASSYAGYFHLVPRLLGAAAAAVGAEAAAAILAIGAAVTTAALAVLVYVASAGHLRAPVTRLLVAAPVVVAPLAQQDVPNSIANLHWPALYAVFWLLVWTPAGRAGRVVAAAVVVLTALSDILVLALLPLAVARAVVRRDRYSIGLAGLLAGCVAVQLAGLLTGASSREISLNLVRPASGYLLRVAPAAVFGERWLPQAEVDTARLVLSTLAWLLVGAVVLVAARRRTGPRWALAGAAAACSVALYALPVILTGVATPRYAFAPALLLITALVALLHPPEPAGPVEPAGRVGPAARAAGRGLAGPLILALACAAVWSANLRVDTARDDGPFWGTGLDRARVECARPAAEAVAVPVSPAGWEATLSCTYLAGR